MKTTQLVNYNFRTQDKLKLYNIINKLKQELKQLKFSTQIKEYKLHLSKTNTIVAQSENKKEPNYYSPLAISKNTKGVALAIVNKLK